MPQEWTAVREFTDREEPQKAFHDKYAQMKARMPGSQSSQVLAYYGIGGIGKTFLLGKLAADMPAGSIHVSLDLESAKDPIDMLDRLKNLLRSECHYSFPLFELGVYLHAQKAGEDAEAPTVQQVSDAHPGLKLALDMLGEIPILGTAVKALQLVDEGAAMYRSFRKSHPKELAQLNAMSVQELKDHLPKLFAQELTQNLQAATTPLVIFLDTYERLVNELAAVGTPLYNDLWLRDANGVIPSVPNTLWVIAGREKLKWETNGYWADNLEQHLLGVLSGKDAAGFLRTAGIRDETLIRQLYALTEGTPLYLDICVEQYEQCMRQGITPDISMFGTDVKKLIERFVRYMDQTQKPLVYLLACLQHWDDALAKAASTEVLTAFHRTVYNRIKNLSFVVAADDKTYYIHRTVGEILMKDPENDLQAEAGQFLIDHFSPQLAEMTPANPAFFGALEHLLHGGLLLHQDRDALDDFYMDTLYKPMGLLIKFGQFAQAEKLLDRLWQRADQGPRDCLYALVLMEKAQLSQYSPFTQAQAIDLAVEALALHTLLLGPDHKRTLTAAGVLFGILFRAKYYKDALPLAAYLLRKNKALFGEDHPETISALNNYASVLSQVNQSEEALALSRQVLEKREALLGPDHSATLSAKYNLAIELRKAKQYEEAKALDMEVAERRKKILVEKHPDTLRAIDNYAADLGCLGQHQDALAIKLKTLENRSAVLGEDHPDTIKASENLALTLMRLERHEEAISLYRIVLKKRLTLGGEYHPDTIRAMRLLASALGASGRQEEATSLMEQARLNVNTAAPSYNRERAQQSQRVRALLQSKEELDRQAAALLEKKAALGEDHPDTLNAMEDLATTLWDFCQYPQAIQMAEELLARRRAVLGNQHPATARAIGKLAIYLSRRPNRDLFQQAEDRNRVYALKKEQYSICLAACGPEHPESMTVLAGLIAALIDLEKREDALPLIQELLRLRQLREAEDPDAVVQTKTLLASNYYHLKQFEEALPLHQDIYRRQQAVWGEASSQAFDAAIRLSSTLAMMKQYKEAITLLEQSVALAYTAPAIDPNIIRIMDIALTDICAQAGLPCPTPPPSDPD